MPPNCIIRAMRRCSSPPAAFPSRRAHFPVSSPAPRTYEGRFETEWAFMRAVLMANGVPENAILREDEATFTYQNAIYSRRRTDAEKLTVRRALLCCMPIHARRAKMYYQTLFPETELLICPAPALPSPAKTGCTNRTASTLYSANSPAVAASFTIFCAKSRFKPLSRQIL